MSTGLLEKRVWNGKTGDRKVQDRSDELLRRKKADFLVKFNVATLKRGRRPTLPFLSAWHNQRSPGWVGKP